MSRTTVVGVREARDNLSQLIRQAKAGEDVVIASRQVLQVRLVPVETGPPRGSGAAVLAALEGVWAERVAPRRSLAEIEAQIAESRDSWE
ncbi:MAG: type II toxin-antitoxin system prevent-host-death family antitoxin [Propionibacteriaceae bacterium]|jgi:prevent-host-death family protein|nr:type II toxin-antitoxin system prevent-host-death family antitoxin [Propionibacteriaceae bacterium]